MAYWDTSTLVKLYAKETDSALFEVHAMRSAAGTVASRIALYEAQATFQRKEAEGILQPGAAQKLYGELLQDVATGEMRLVELGPDVEREYGQVLTLCYQQMIAVLSRSSIAVLNLQIHLSNLSNTEVPQRAGSGLYRHACRLIPRFCAGAGDFHWPFPASEMQAGVRIVL